MKKPSMSETISAIAAKREVVSSAKSDIDISTSRDVEMPVSMDDGKSIPHAVRGGARNAKPEVAGTLPKMTLYAHADVLKAVRRIAVDDGVQAQVILREALREYLAKRGHHFSDLSTGK